MFLYVPLNLQTYGTWVGIPNLFEVPSRPFCHERPAISAPGRVSKLTTSAPLHSCQLAAGAKRNRHSKRQKNSFA